MCCLLDLMPANNELFGALKAEGSLGGTDLEMMTFRIQRGEGDRQRAGLQPWT